ncbi:MAG: glycosyltransferase [Kiritimatiellae bacterium]|nr:glycosyltransferase [Kiritimatiellia bacterium]
MKPVVHQLLASFRRGDAIGEEAVRIRDLCEAHGVECRLWSPAHCVPPAERRLALDAAALPAAARPGDVALLHLSIGSPVNDLFAALPCRRVALYHNVTPPRFFERVQPATAARLEAGLAAVRRLAACGAEAWADSAFNAAELRAAGWRDPKVLPLLFDPGFGRTPPDPLARARLSEPPRENLLFVGRIAPNKRHDRLLRLVHAYRAAVNPAGRLVAAGGAAGLETWQALLKASASTLVLGDGVLFTGFLSPAELAACYATASAFVCLSDHEGFCAPLLEAMAWRVPVFAAAAGAVPETLGGAGVLFDPAADEATMAETVGRVLHDPALREAVLAKQDARLARFRARDEWAELRAVLGLT